MAGLSSIVNLGYHGTSPAIADAIATSGFKGGTVPTWAGKGNVFTSNIDVAQRYGPKQLGVVTSAKNLTSPFGGGFNKSGISFGKEIVSNPAQATKGLNAFERMKLKYPNSPTFQRLLKTGTTAITNPTNWARVLGLPLSVLTGILSSTPANAGEQEWIDMMNERRFKNYGPWTQGTPHMPNQRFKQQQLMNKKKQDMQQRIREAEAAKQKAAADAKAKADAAAHKKAQATGGDYHSGHESTVGGQTTDWGSESAMIARGGLAQHAPRYANGGLIDFFRYGGFIGQNSTIINTTTREIRSTDTTIICQRR